MDLRKTKRKRSEHEESNKDIYFRLSFPKERSTPDEDTFYSCNSSFNSSEDSNYNPESEIQPRSFKRRARCQISDANSFDFVVEKKISMDGVHDQSVKSHHITTHNTAQTSELRTEIVKKKENSNNYNCLYCNGRFSELRSFKSHIEAGMCLMNSTLFDGWKVCSGCKHLYSNLYNLRRHLKTSCQLFKNVSPE